MRLNIATKFRLAESIRALLPWSDNVYFTIRWIGNADYQRFIEEHPGDRTFANQTAQLGAKAATLAAIEAEQKHLKGKARSDYVDRRSNELYAELLRETELEIAGISGTSPEGVARHLIADVENLLDEETGQPVVYTADVGLEILTATEPIIESAEFESESGEGLLVVAGTPFGVAVKRWVLWMAGQADRFRRAQAEGAARD